MPFDLVLLSLGGVQRFISESRSTADVVGVSKIVREQASRAARFVQDRLAGSSDPCGLIFPAAADAMSVTNKIAFLAEAGDGPGITKALVGRSPMPGATSAKRPSGPTRLPTRPACPI